MESPDELPNLEELGSQDVDRAFLTLLNKPPPEKSELRVVTTAYCTFLEHYESHPTDDYTRYRTRALTRVLKFLSTPGAHLEVREPADRIMRVCFKMIENSSTNGLTKNKDLLDINFSLLGYGIEKYDQSLSFCLKFIQLLQYKEQLAPLLADLVEFIVTRHEQRLLIGEILREIARIDVKELSRDSSCPRAVSTFLITLSEKCPQDFVRSLNYMFDFLECDSYIMRNASLTILANIIMKVLHGREEDKALRDELLDVLLAHIRDITSYTRSKALAIWTNLAYNKSIPLSHIVPVTSAVVSRLCDKSCLVRKNAVRFIISILSTNPFAPKLPLKAFLERYEVEKSQLDKLEAEEAERRADDVLETLSQSSQDSAGTAGEAGAGDNGSQKEVAISEESAVVIQTRKVTFLQHAISLTKQIHKAIPLTTEMLTSKNITDIQEAIDFFVHCHEFGIDEALVGFKRMILLVHVQEKSVKDAISLAYQRIFFESSRYDGKPNRDSLIATNLINFVREATIGECLSLELLLAQFKESGHLTKDLTRELWARFTRAKSNTAIEESIAAIQLIGMVASVKPDIINHNLQLCSQYGLPSVAPSEVGGVAGDTGPTNNNESCQQQERITGDQESRLVRETCIAIRKSLPRKMEDRNKRPMRLAKDDEIVAKLQAILANNLSNLAFEHWFSVCDEALRIIFDMAENPDKICETLFGQLAERLLRNAVQDNNSRNISPDLVFQPSSMQVASTQASQAGSQHPPTTELVHATALARFIHFLGDVALNLAVFLELHVLLELKLRTAALDSNKSDANINAHNMSISNRRRSMRYGNKAANRSMEEQNLDEEMGLAGAEAEDAEMEFIGAICDEEAVCGKNLLAKLSRVIIEIVTDPNRYPQDELKQASSLALSKYMMVSAKYCHDHLRLLFTILEKTKDTAIKINLLVAISDLCIRFPNQLDGWTGKIFDCLQSDQVEVRRAALKILSRLVLCDILKAKDQISTMANLIVDRDEQIAAYSRHFFLELSKKLNAIYNVLPDIISRLSDSKTGIAEEEFRIVMKFIFELIDKSQHIDRLVDKLCGRFMDTVDERHWADLAYCLSLLRYSDKSMAKLFDKFDCYKDKLCIDAVRDSISATVNNYRKTPHLRQEMKQLLDEFEAKIAKCLGEEEEEEAGSEAYVEGRGSGAGAQAPGDAEMAKPATPDNGAASTTQNDDSTISSGAPDESQVQRASGRGTRTRRNRSPQTPEPTPGRRAMPARRSTRNAAR